MNHNNSNNNSIIIIMYFIYPSKMIVITMRPEFQRPQDDRTSTGPANVCLRDQKKFQHHHLHSTHSNNNLPRLTSEPATPLR